MTRPIYEHAVSLLKQHGTKPLSPEALAWARWIVTHNREAK